MDELKLYWSLTCSAKVLISSIILRNSNPILSPLEIEFFCKLVLSLEMNHFLGELFLRDIILITLSFVHKRIK